MNKIKLIIASMIGAIVLVFACVFGFGVNVNAKTVSFYKADNDQHYSTETTYSYVKNEIAVEDSNLSITPFAAAATLVSKPLNDYNVALYYSENSVSTKTTESKNKYFKFTNRLNNQSIIVTAYFAADDGSSLKSTSAGFRDVANSTNIVTTNTSTTDVVSLTVTIPQGETYALFCESRRIRLYEVKYKYHAADDVEITFNDGGNTLDTIPYGIGESIDYIPTKTNYKFEGWYTNSDLAAEHKLANNYTVDGETTNLYAKFSEYSYLLGQNEITALDKTNGVVPYYNETIFQLPTETVCQTGQTKVLPDGTGGSSTAKRISPSKGFISFVAPKDGVLNVWVVPGSNELSLDLKNITDSTDESITLESSSVSVAYNEFFNVKAGKTYQIGNGSSRMYYYKFEFIEKSITVMQQEVPNQTIGETTGTYIRFIALVKGVEDINSSDFTFKIYREKDNVIQSITRSVSTYSRITSNGDTYSKALPGESVNHNFDGAYKTEFYALFVIGLSDSTYSGYKVYGGFTFNGTEYKTSGYTFA